MSTDHPYPCPDCTDEKRCDACEQERRELAELLRKWTPDTTEGLT